MPDACELLKTIKRAAVDSVNAYDPVHIYYATVIKGNPLQIQLEQKLILGPEQLVLSRNVTDFITTAAAAWENEKTETREITIHNRLVVGEEVILLRQQEGQKFIVLDRVGI